ncbi:DUF418 domain-containing protein [Nonomuraea sp. NN258]|uniref:DUF418 domain-containing protein n=1 Tax=Nonomuraea antri TaxID=2730852 RepID=UPI0015699ADB|nr:DUF418 domain-containing protein [Nonomuraea antri]NRQ30844.1 DUF418 domain-containing protein [Nonomuraea antri]
MSLTVSPPPSTARVVEVDAVRGFALAGILVANIGFLADPGHAVVGQSPISDGPVAFGITAFVLTKFYVIFSFLFGYSFTLQMRAAERAGASVRARTVRRCLALLAIGLLHGFLFWIGDILTLYAALGLVLLLFRNIKPRTAVIVGSVIIGLLTLLWLALAGLSLLDPAAGQVPPVDTAAAARALDLATAGPLDFLRLQTELYPQLVAMIWLFQGPTALAMFLFGLAAGKSRLLEEPRSLSRVQWVGFGVGIPSGIFFAWTSGSSGALETLGLAVNTLTSLLLAAAYVATLVRLVRRVPAVARVLAPAGHMAASNYIGQSVLSCLVFTGYGLALAGRLSPIAVMGVAAVIYAVLATFSALWLRRHRHGPVEYGLRRITNWS